MSWQVLTFITVLTFSASVILRRRLLHHHQSDPIAYVIAFQGLVGIFTGVYALFHGFTLPNLGLYWPAMLLTAALYAVAHIASAKTLQIVEASVFAVLFATSAFWTMLASSFLLSDHLTASQILGAGLILLSIGLLQNKRISLDRGTWLGLITGMLFGLATAGWVYVGRHTDPISWTAVSFLGAAILVLIVQPKAIRKLPTLLERALLLRLVLLGAIVSISSFALLSAYTKGNAHVVTALQQTSIIVVTLLGIVLLGERQQLRRKLLAAGISFAAVLLIV